MPPMKSLMNPKPYPAWASVADCAGSLWCTNVSVRFATNAPLLKLARIGAAVGMLILVGSEVPTERGLDAERREVASARDFGTYALGIADTGDRGLIVGVEREVGEDVLRIAKGSELGI